jgi:hypothetical protein
MFDIDEDVTPVEEYGNNLPNQTHLDKKMKDHISQLRVV